MMFDEIMILCQTICVCLTLSLLCFGIIQYVVYSKAEHKAKMKLFEKEEKLKIIKEFKKWCKENKDEIH